MAYVAAAVPLALYIPAYDNFHGNNLNLLLVLSPYRKCFYILLFGGFAQMAYGRKLECIVTFVFVAVAYYVNNHSWFHT